MREPLSTRPSQIPLSIDLEKHLGWYSASNLLALGDPQIANRNTLALFCSRKCSGSLIIQTHDLAHALRDATIAVIGGFHSPVERECLNVLLKGTQPLIICPARSLDGMRIPTTWRTPIQQGRLLLLSPFEKKHHRATAEIAQKRNEFVATLADSVFVAYAAPGSATETLCRKALNWRKRIFTFQVNENLLRIGATPAQGVPVDNLEAQRFWFRDSTKV